MQSQIPGEAMRLVKAGCRVFCEAGCRCAPFCTIKHRLLAYLFTAWLFPTGVRSACKETMYYEERETGLEPATACLEGRNSTTELLPLMDIGDLCCRIGRGARTRTADLLVPNQARYQLRHTPSHHYSTP